VCRGGRGGTCCDVVGGCGRGGTVFHKLGMPRRRLKRGTKIVATLGPATDAPGVLEGVTRAGAAGLRVNSSHGNPADHARRAANAADGGLRGDQLGHRDRDLPGRQRLRADQGLVVLTPDVGLDPVEGEEPGMGEGGKGLPRRGRTLSAQPLLRRRPAQRGRPPARNGRTVQQPALLGSGARVLRAHRVGVSGQPAGRVGSFR